MNPERLASRIAEIQRQSDLIRVGVFAHDFENSADFSLAADEWFHAASVIKVAVLLALHKAAEIGTVRLDDPLHVRNRFRSAVDGSIFRVERDRDGDADCHRRVGRTMRLADLAHAMITRSSNLATNLLLDLLGIETARQLVARIDGVKLQRGVEDHVAFEAGLNNELTPRGAAALFRAVCEDGFVGEFARQQMRDVLLAQQFNSMLPARLPDEVKVAHKTGEISTHTHDAGILFFPDRKPCIVAVLTEHAPDLDERSKPVAAIAHAIFEEFTAA